jgi:RNA polymerase sigma factor FliA
VRVGRSHLELVYRTAHSIHRRLPRVVEFGDLIGNGFVGLKDAMRHFDRERGIEFSRFAISRIRGAILDGLRSRDVILRRRLRGVQVRVPHLHPLAVDPSYAPQIEYRAAQVALIRDAIQGLPRRSRLVMHLYYVEGLSMQDVGGCFGVSQSRISQLHARLVRQLREATRA